MSNLALLMASLYLYFSLVVDSLIYLHEHVAAWGMAQSEECSLLTMKSRVRSPTVLNNTMQYALIPNYAKRMELPLVAPPGAGGRVPKKKKKKGHEYN